MIRRARDTFNHEYFKRVMAEDTKMLDMDYVQQELGICVLRSCGSCWKVFKK